MCVKINSCNGRNCGDTFVGPNRPNKPVLWTENWTAQYRVFGDPPSQRSAEDLAFSVARFFSKNGMLVNYSMYHGGTNFGRIASSFITTRCYNEAPLDEYGFQKEPKCRHLRDLHSALRLCGKALLWGLPTVYTMGKDIEVTSQHNARGYHLVKESHKDKEWKMHPGKIPTISDTCIRSTALLELMNLTKDRTDYL
ncbi:beta-galactosidase 11-like [Magnolia sinica]|uniref:beta-galactosidase 11-like n=1 Tax=Magnolia sinica TaxID=86752 RepID=UPI00265A0911|nr:beta-galactosidase 11-like [Magnolia sinica]